MEPDSWEHSLTAIALGGGVVAFLVGLWQYRKAQLWKRAEWVAAQIDTFWNTPAVINAMAMIDWGKRDIPLFTHVASPEQSLVLVDDGLVKRALMHHTAHYDTYGEFSREEVAIRDCFDCFLDGLEGFENFIESNLIDVGDIYPYLDYWVRRVAGVHESSINQPRLIQLRKYIDDYEFDGVKTLIDRWGKYTPRKVPA